MGPASRGQAALAGIRKTLDVGLAIPQIAASEPERPCAAALSLEDWRTERNSGQRSYDRLLEAPGVSDAADAVGSLQRASDGPFGGRYLGRLAHLDLPDEISPGTGLILPQNHGTPQPDPQAGIHRVCWSRRSRKTLIFSHPRGVLSRPSGSEPRPPSRAARTQPRGSSSPPARAMNRKAESITEQTRYPARGRGRWRRPAAGRGTLKIRSAPYGVNPFPRFPRLAYSRVAA